MRSVMAYRGWIAAITLAAGLCGLALTALGGCYGYHDLVDPCYPTRYDAMSRAEENAAIAPQVTSANIISVAFCSTIQNGGESSVHSLR